MPTGGLISEISHISTRNTPNHTGSIPAATISGCTSGSVPTIIGSVSKKVPRIHVEREQDVDELQEMEAGAAKAATDPRLAPKRSSHPSAGVLPSPPIAPP